MKKTFLLRLNKHVSNSVITYVVVISLLSISLMAGAIYCGVAFSKQGDSISSLKSDKDSLYTASNEDKQQIEQLQSDNKDLKDALSKIYNAVVSEHSQEIDSIYTYCINSTVVPGSLAKIESLERYHSNCHYTESSWVETYSGISGFEINLLLNKN